MSTSAIVQARSGINPLVLVMAAAVGGLIFLPGWTKAAVPVGLFAAMVAGNWSHCKQIAFDSGIRLLDTTTGQYLDSDVATSYGSYSIGCPAGHVCTAVNPTGSPMPQWSCLSNPFPGGL